MIASALIMAHTHTHHALRIPRYDWLESAVLSTAFTRLLGRCHEEAVDWCKGIFWYEVVQIDGAGTGSKTCPEVGP